MAIPEQIRKQSEAVQELYAQLNQDDSGEVQETPPADDQEVAQSQEQKPEQEQVEQAAADESTETNQAAPLPESEQNTGGEKVTEEVLTQKYRTLQGMYNAEVPRLHSQNKELQQRLHHMEQLLASFDQQKSTKQEPVQVEKLVSEQDVEEYGESIDVMRKVTREELGTVASRIAQLEQTIQQLQSNVVPQVQAVAQRQAASSEQAFWANLGSAVPNWKEVNNDKNFQSWLLEADPLTGISRQTYLEDAQRSMDADRVARFFRTWLENNGQASVAHTSQAQPKPSSELERQVAPGKSKNSGAPKANEGRTYTPEDIQNFFADVRKGKYKGRESERDKIERDIFAAQRENRIRVNA